MSIYTLFYGVQIVRRGDPNRWRCLFWAVAGFIGIFVWTYSKLSHEILQHYGAEPREEAPILDEG